MFVKGIKKGKTIELLEEVNFPDNQEVLVEIREIHDFWSDYQEFRKKIEQEGIIFDDDDFANLRDKSRENPIPVNNPDCLKWNFFDSYPLTLILQLNSPNQFDLTFVL